MAIRNTKLGGATDWSSEKLKSEDLNDTFDATFDRTLKVIGTDLVGGSSSSPATDTKLAEVSITGGTVIDYIVISVLFDGRMSTSTGSARLDLKVGESGSEVSVNDSPFDVSASGVATVTRVSSIEYYYEPTTAEKTNGFNVQAFVKAQSGAILEVFQLIVKGA